MLLLRVWVMKTRGTASTLPEQENTGTAVLLLERRSVSRHFCLPTAATGRWHCNWSGPGKELGLFSQHDPGLEQGQGQHIPSQHADKHDEEQACHCKTEAGLSAYTIDDGALQRQCQINFC